MKKTWRITITPTRTGLDIKTVANVNDKWADLISRSVERNLADLATVFKSRTA